MVAADAEVGRLADLVAAGDVMVLSGAGPVHRVGHPRLPRADRRRSARASPMTYQTFTGDPAARQRYWARSQLGWRVIARAVPERRPPGGRRAAAPRSAVRRSSPRTSTGCTRPAARPRVVELHGNLDRVVCLGCLERTPRAELDLRLREANPGWAAEATAINPDGDVALDDAVVATFRLVDCRSCGGLLKPDVVFFGENVPPAGSRTATTWWSGRRALLVLGSSLSVMSGLRFVPRAATATGVPVAIVNQGWTRGDDLATLKVDAPLGRTLAALA